MRTNPAKGAARAASRSAAATILLVGTVGAAGAFAQDWTSPRAGDRATRAWERPGGEAKAAAPKRTYSHEESTRMGAEVQRQAEARQRGWERKMKAVSGSICRGC
jgi:hypothetical protein